VGERVDDEDRDGKVMATVVKATRAANSREGELGPNEALSDSISPASFALSGGLSML